MSRTPFLVTTRSRLRRLRGAPSPLAGRTVLVTGASSGIGEATARLAAQRGARLLLAARRADELDRVREDIVAAGGTAYAYPCDLTDAEEVDSLVARLLDEHGVVDMVVNCAGRSIRRPLSASFDRAHDFERTMAINYFGPVRLLLGLLPAMVEQGFGQVVNIGTWGIQVKAPKFAAYIASKTALDTFSRIAGREFYADGVTFTNVRMSLVRTDMIAPTEAYRRMPAKSPQDAAEIVVRALEDRPLTVNVLAGTVSEVLNLVAPRASDALFSRIHRRVR